MKDDFRNVQWLIDAIRRLPSDARVPDRTPGFNVYSTQKDHWLGWLDPTAGTGTYPRQGGKDDDAKTVYNRIVEPKMLLWLIAAAGVRAELRDAAERAASNTAKLGSKSAAIRRVVPWSEVVVALET